MGLGGLLNKEVSRTRELGKRRKRTGWPSNWQISFRKCQWERRGYPGQGNGNTDNTFLLCVSKVISYALSCVLCNKDGREGDWEVLVSSRGGETEAGPR